jgi:hypothetical protein
MWRYTLGLSRSLLIRALTVSALLAVLSVGQAARATIASAAPQEEDQEHAVVEVKVPELSRAEIRSPESVCLRPSTVVCEDFEKWDKSNWSDYKNNALYVENDASLSGKRSLRQYYAQDQAVAGWLGWHFGDHPEGGLRSDESFEEIYFRFYHRFQKSWPDQFPPKFARVGSRYPSKGLQFAWQEQLLISGRRPGAAPISTPISSLAEPAGTVHMGDGNLRWLDREQLDVRFVERKGEWVAIEMRVKLNTPGQSDGRITYWLNDEVVLDREGLNLRGAYTETSINLAMLEGYWNGGSPRDGLKRWFDNVVIASEPVGCAVYSVRKKGLDDQSAWQLQVATAADEAAIVWDSGNVPGAGEELDVSERTGTFVEGASRCLLPKETYLVRARHAVGDTWSAWSEWSPMFE